MTLNLDLVIILTIILLLRKVTTQADNIYMNIAPFIVRIDNKLV